MRGLKTGFISESLTRRRKLDKCKTDGIPSERCHLLYDKKSQYLKTLWLGGVRPPTKAASYVTTSAEADF
jgi:hypothetical protein